jgi:hypothetical protein
MAFVLPLLPLSFFLVLVLVTAIPTVISSDFTVLIPFFILFFAFFLNLISIFSIEPSTLIAGMAPASANVLEDTSSLDLLANAAMPHLLALFDGHSLSTFARREIIIVTADRHVSIFDGRATGHERRIGPQA